MTKFLSAAVLLLCLSGCHRNKVKFIEFILDPNPAAKTLSIQCVGSSSGKCGFAFDAGTPSDALLDAGTSIAITAIPPSAMFCAGTVKPSITACRKSPLPDHKSTVRRETSTPARASN